MDNADIAKTKLLIMLQPKYDMLMAMSNDNDIPVVARQCILHTLADMHLLRVKESTK